MHHFSAALEAIPRVQSRLLRPPFAYIPAHMCAATLLAHEMIIPRTGKKSTNPPSEQSR